MQSDAIPAPQHSPRRAQAYSDDDDEEMLVDHYGDAVTPRSNMPLRGKRGKKVDLGL